MKKLLILILAVIFAPSVAQARHHHHYVHARAYHHYQTYGAGQIVPHPAGCPWIASCGCIASVKIFGRPVRDLYLASNWGRFPSAAPGPGKAAYRAHHVFVILSVTGPGRVLAYDGNSGGHLTRIHEVSLAGYRVVDPQGGRSYANNSRFRRVAGHHRRRYADNSYSRPRGSLYAASELRVFGSAATSTTW